MATLSKMSIEDEYQKLWAREKKRASIYRWLICLAVGVILLGWYLGPYMLALYFGETVKPVIQEILEAETESVKNIRSYSFKDIYVFETFRNLIQKNNVPYKVEPFSREMHVIKFVDTYENIKRVTEILEENKIHPDAIKNYKEINKVSNKSTKSKQNISWHQD